MSGHLDGPPPGPPDPPYIPGDLGAPSPEEFARRRASSEPRPENPYAPSADWKPGQDTFTAQAAGIWQEGFAAGIARACKILDDAATNPEHPYHDAADLKDAARQIVGARAERDAAIAALREADELLRRVDPFTGTFAMGADSEDLWRADVAAWRALPGCCDRPVPEGETT